MPVVCTVITCNFLDFFIYLFFHSNNLVYGLVLFRFPTCPLFWSHDVAVPDHWINTTVQHWQMRRSDGFHYRFPVLFVDPRFTKELTNGRKPMSRWLLAVRIYAERREDDDLHLHTHTQKDARMLVSLIGYVVLGKRQTEFYEIRIQ